MREKRIAIFIDGSNFSAALRSAGFRMNYDKLLEDYKQKGTVVDASYFTALPPRDVYAPVRALTDRLQYHGWSLVSKETKDMISVDGIFRTKGNMDVEIAVKAMKIADHITDFVLCSGDGDFRYLVEVLQEKTIHVTAISSYSHKEDHNQIADELRRQVNTFIDLKTVRDKYALI